MNKRLVGAFLCALALSSCNWSSDHEQACRTPLPNWRTPGDGWHNAIKNNVAITANGDLTWNGEPITPEELQRFLALVPTLNPVPATILTVDPLADCTKVSRIRQAIDEALKCRQNRMCGEGESGGDWDAPPYVDENSAAYKELANEADRLSQEAEKGGHR